MWEGTSTHDDECEKDYLHLYCVVVDVVAAAAAAVVGWHGSASALLHGYVIVFPAPSSTMHPTQHRIEEHVWTFPPELAPRDDECIAAPPNVSEFSLILRKLRYN